MEEIETLEGTTDEYELKESKKEEEAKIGKNAFAKKKSTRGRKSTKKHREQATYKDKLQGSQRTLERILQNSINTKR